MRVFLSLGSNITDREYNIRQALIHIQHEICETIVTSSLYRTQSWGYDDTEYLNMCISFETSLSPEKLHEKTQAIERAMGRHKESQASNTGRRKYKARKIDIDILFCDQLIINKPELIVPHPQIQYRRFVLKPLAQIAGDFIHPVLMLSIRELLARCEDKLYVEEWKM